MDIENILTDIQKNLLFLTWVFFLIVIKLVLDILIIMQYNNASEDNKKKLKTIYNFSLACLYTQAIALGFICLSILINTKELNFIAKALGNIGIFCLLVSMIICLIDFIVYWLNYNNLDETCKIIQIIYTIIIACVIPIFIYENEKMKKEDIEATAFNDNLYRDD
jgi:hypothetical protein